MIVQKIINDIIEVEGGYSDNPNDTGGKTKYGITEAVARANGWAGDMKDLTKEFAYQVYLNQYYNIPQFNKVAELSEAIAAELTDTAVNCGVPTACPMLQEALNLLNRQDKDYTDVLVDGHIGSNTLVALAKYLQKRGSEGEKVMLKILNIMQGSHYIRITKSRPANEQFIYGWIANRIG